MNNPAVFLLAFMIGLIGLPANVTAQIEPVPLFPISPITSYANYPVNELNRAHRQELTGQFEVALLTYNSALAFQPEWVPALAARAELLYRLGRDAEARRDHLRAQRTNATATNFFLSRGPNGLLPFLALYPHDWYAERYGFDEDLGLPGGDPVTPEAYFTHQYFRIIGATDTAVAVRFLQQKVERNVMASKQLLDELPRDYNSAVKSMLKGNLAMLNHDYPEAIELYNAAESQTIANWPEVFYNRGLGRILMQDYMNGCADLSRAARSGYAPAATMHVSLCDL